MAAIVERGHWMHDHRLAKLSVEYKVCSQLVQKHALRSLSPVVAEKQESAFAYDELA